MFNRVLKKAVKAIKRNKFTIADIEKYLPRKNDAIIVRKKPSRNKLISAISVGVVGVLAGLGVAKIIKDRTTKKVIILVGEDKNSDFHAPVGGFGGYLLKYTDLTSLDELTDNLALNGFTELVIVPMTLLNGYETEQIKNIMLYKGELFERISYAPAVLTTDRDFEAVANTLAACTADTDCDTAIVYLGKGTTHFSNAAYTALSERVRAAGADNVFIGTLSGYPGLDKVKSDVADGHYQNVIICPLELSIDEELEEAMSENNEDSWYNAFANEGYNCGSYYKSLCAYRGIRRLIVEHTKETVKAE